MAIKVQAQKFDVGGVLLDRPFKVRRLGHFGFNNVHMEESLRFYTELLGFRISDVRNFGARAQPGQLDGMGDPNGYFTHHGGDHHSFVLFNKRVREALDTRREFRPGVTVNQITWQCGSLAEIGQATPWLQEHGQKLQRVGRDMPGSNWHTYFYDPDGNTNELYYGIEQIGWMGCSKPTAMYDRGFQAAPELPQISEEQEVEDARATGVDITSGYRYVDGPGTYDVDGILLPRPFKVVRIGPVRLFATDMAASEAFYQDMMGFVKTEEVSYEGQRCVFLRCNTEHHSMALYPVELRQTLGMREDTLCMSFGLQLANYRQLRDAMTFLREKGCTVRELPPELFPGMGHSAFALDPDGHAVQLYAYMEQIGWDGQPRP
ncbi:MAG TPA: VOC family protein, partial [Chloroflexota bacterium]|nr:VOC family protein [Chloroflexota bacterium]